MFRVVLRSGTTCRLIVDVLVHLDFGPVSVSAAVAWEVVVAPAAAVDRTSNLHVLFAVLDMTHWRQTEYWYQALN